MMGKVSKEQYAEAVARFVVLARQPTSGGRVAAQVLLSTYNGSDFQLDLASMGNLDRSVELAMTIIRDVTRDSWFALHVTERGKAGCPDCDGRGSLWLNLNDENDNRTKPCRRCGGHGRVCRCGR